MRLYLPVVIVFAFACGQRETVHPDGGRDRNVCTQQPATIIVRVLEPSGAPVEGATVTATNLGTGRQLTATTNGQGVTSAIDEEVGPGTVVIRASKENRASGASNVNFVCGVCSCSGEPNFISLTLN